MSKLKVEGFDSLVRDTNSNAIVNTSKSEFQLYMKRVKSREEQDREFQQREKRKGAVMFGEVPRLG